LTTLAFLCSVAGVQAIRDDIERVAVTDVMIAACSRRAKTEAFRLLAINAAPIAPLGGRGRARN
jgi:heterodisulfide reductase subunit A-like polyferredoxin